MLLYRPVRMLRWKKILKLGFLRERERDTLRKHQKPRGPRGPPSSPADAASADRLTPLLSARAR